MNNPFVDNQFTNNETKLLQTWVVATIKEMHSQVRLTKKKGEDNELLEDDAQTPFRQAVVEITTPMGTKTIDANIWEASKIANEDIFEVGKEVAAVFDLEGEFKGSVWLSLPPKRNIDLNWFGAPVEAKAETPATETPAESDAKI